MSGYQDLCIRAICTVEMILQKQEQILVQGSGIKILQKCPQFNFNVTIKSIVIFIQTSMTVFF